MAQDGHSDATRFAGLRALLVEDESMVAMLVESMLLDLDMDVTLAMRLPEALDAARSGPFHLAVLDVNLGGLDRSDEVADVLSARSIPFAFATGYGTRGLADRFRHVPTIQKPFSQKTLCDILALLLDTRSEM